MIDVTGGGKIYGINRPINEIIINDKPWEELKDEAGYIKRFADFDGDKVDLKLGCKELDRDLYTGLIETTDGRKWIRKYSPPYPFFIPSGTDWIYIGYDTSVSSSSSRTCYYYWIRFKESVYICFLSYHVINDPYNSDDHRLFYVSDHPVEYEIVYVSQHINSANEIVGNIWDRFLPDQFVLSINKDEYLYDGIVNYGTIDSIGPNYWSGYYRIVNSLYQSDYPPDFCMINGFYIVPCTMQVHYNRFGDGKIYDTKLIPYILTIDTSYKVSGYNELYYYINEQIKASIRKIYGLYTSTSTDEKLYWLNEFMNLDKDVDL